VLQVIDENVNFNKSHSFDARNVVKIGIKPFLKVHICFKNHILFVAA